MRLKSCVEREIIPLLFTFIRRKKGGGVLRRAFIAPACETPSECEEESDVILANVFGF